MQSRLRVASAVALGFIAQGVHGAEWENGVSLGVSSFYSDNICRAPNIQQEKVVGTATPAVSVRGTGARANVALNAAAEYNTLGDSSFECEERGAGGGLANRRAWVPRVAFASQLEAVENAFFLEANALARQNAINPFAAGGDDNVNAAGNTNVTYRWGAGARIDRRLGERLALLLRYNYNEQYNSFNRALGDSQEDRVEMDVGMIPQASRFSLGVRGQYSEVTFEETELRPEFTNRLSRLELRSALRLDRSFSLTASLGEEDNVFVSASDEIDGSYWDAGFVWTPNSRVEVSAGYGERFFGETPRFNASYRHKRSQLVASYVRDIRFPRNIRAGESNPDDPFDPGLGLPGEPLPGGGDPTFIGQGPVLTEAFALSYRFDARRTSFTLSARDSQQTRVEDLRSGSFQSATATVSRQLGSGTSANLRILLRNNTGQLGEGFEEQGQDIEAISVSCGLSRRLADNASMNLRYTYTDQQSDNERNTFQENRISVGVRYDF